MRRSPLFLVFLFICSISGAQQPSPAAQPQIKADNVDYDFQAGILSGRGNARVQLDDVTLTADELRYLHRTRTVEARGHVVLVRDDRRLLASEISYHLDTGSYRVRNLRFGAAPLYVSGSLLEGSRETLTFNDAVVTYQEPGRWAPTLVADSVTYHPQRQRMRATGAALGVGWWQPLPLPSAELPTHISFLSYLSANAGYTGSLGAFVEVGVHLPVGEVANLGGDVGYFSDRGFMFGPSGTYHWGAGTDREASGEFSTGFIHDSGEKFVDILREPVPEDRGFVTWTHRQHFTPQLSLGAVLNYWSDSEVMRDFRPRDFFPVQTPDNYAELVYLGDNIVFSAFVRPQVNDYHTVRERLPELSFAVLPSPVGGGWYHELQTSAVRLRDEPPAGGTVLRSDRLDAYYALMRPYSPREWLTLSPVVGGRLTHYTNIEGSPATGTRDQRDDYTRALGEIGADAELRASGTFDYRNDRWGIDGLRHLITPKLSYRYIPDATKGAQYIPAIDRRVFATYLQPLGLGNRRQIDDLEATNTLRLSLDNRLQTRDGHHGSRDLAALNIAADTRFDRAAGERTLSSLHTELSVTPARWVGFDLYHRLAPHSGVTQELNAGITLLDSDRWAVRLANHYLAGDIQEYHFGATYRLNEVYQLYTRIHYDSRRSRFNEQIYGLNQILENRWIVSYELSFFDGRQRESDFGFNLRLETMRF
jgi:LPS-assembly protein